MFPYFLQIFRSNLTKPHTIIMNKQPFTEITTVNDTTLKIEVFTDNDSTTEEITFTSKISLTNYITFICICLIVDFLHISLILVLFNT